MMDKYLKCRVYRNRLGRRFIWTEDGVLGWEKFEARHAEVGKPIKWLSPEFSIKLDPFYDAKTDFTRVEETTMRLADSWTFGPLDSLCGISTGRLREDGDYTANALRYMMTTGEKARRRIADDLVNSYREMHPAIVFAASTPTGPSWVKTHFDKQGTNMNEPTPQPHAGLQVEYKRQEVSGELAAGWWQWQYWPGLNGTRWVPCDSQFDRHVVPLFEELVLYRYITTDKHPSYVPPKPECKLIDMSKLPVGSVVKLTGFDKTRFRVFGLDGLKTVVTSLLTGEKGKYDPQYLRIAEQKEFTYWGGGRCPVPEGLRVEAQHREYFGPNDLNQCRERFSVTKNSCDWLHTGSRLDIIAYRIIGMADGWTDNPELAK